MTRKMMKGPRPEMPRGPKPFPAARRVVSFVAGKMERQQEGRPRTNPPKGLFLTPAHKPAQRAFLGVYR